MKCVTKLWTQKLKWGKKKYFMIFCYNFVRGTRCLGLSVRVCMKVFCIFIKIPIIFPENNAQSMFQANILYYLFYTTALVSNTATPVYIFCLYISRHVC